MWDSLPRHLVFAATEGAVFFCAVWAATRVFRGMPATLKCWLWRMVSIKFALGLLFLISLPVTVNTQAQASGTVGKVTAALLRTIPRSESPTRPSFSRTQVRSTPRPFQSSFAAPAQSIPTETSSAAIQPRGHAVSAQGLIESLWLLGMAIVVIRSLLAFKRVDRILRDSSEMPLVGVDPGMGQVFARSGHRSNPKVRVLDDLAAPALLGLFRPTIVLPSDIRSTSPEAVSSAFAHELAHLKRRDSLWILLAEAMKAVFWFHPFAWIACREQRIEAEIAADRLARTWTGASPREYAQHLLEWIDPSRANRVSVVAVPGLVPSTHELIIRVKAMSLRRYSGKSSFAIGTFLGIPLAIALAPIMLFAISGTGLASSPWPKFHGGLDNAGRSSGSGAIGVKKWSFEIADDSGDPAIGPDGTIYLGSGHGTVFALNGATGAKKWSFKTDYCVASTPAISSDGTLFFGSQDNKLYAVNSATGAKKWTFKTGGLIYPAPTIGTDGTVYIGSWDGYVYALDGGTGAKIWSFKTAGPVTSDAAIGDDGTVYIGSHGSAIYALNGKTGAKKWSFTAEDTINSPSIGPDGTVYVGSWDGKVYALDGSTGKQKWATQTGDEVQSCPAVGLDGTIYVGSEDHRVYALDGKTGGRKWAFITGGPIEASPAIGGDGTVYVGSKDEHFYALNGKTGARIWDFDGSSGFVASPAIGSDGTIYVGSEDGTFYALR